MLGKMVWKTTLITPVSSKRVKTTFGKQWRGW